MERKTSKMISASDVTDDDHAGDIDTSILRDISEVIQMVWMNGQISTKLMMSQKSLMMSELKSWKN